VRQSANDPPVLTVAEKTAGTHRVLWDPTPQLRDIAWGEVSLIQWKDASGADYTANLLKPPGYVAGRRYPLVIQTHGSLSADRFIAAGLTTTGFAGREMAAARHGRRADELERKALRRPRRGPGSGGSFRQPHRQAQP